MSEKAEIKANIISNKAIGPCFCKLSLRIPEQYHPIMSRFLPGQFAQVAIENLGSPANPRFSPRQSVLRKPFSFSSVEITKNHIIAHILYCVLGPGSEKMTTIKAGDEISMIAPLGTSFTVSDDLETALLVGGGMGAVPLQSLAEYIHKNHPKKRMIAFIGARAVKGLPFFHTHDHLEKGKIVTEIEEFEKYGAKTYIATDDGSAGVKGFVTELLADKVRELSIKPENTMIYTCGPEPMMKAVAGFAHKNNFKCQVSLERMMACGIGLCQSCAVECSQPGQTETVYKLCCKDGPVFDSAEVCW
jgi:dihydroorotate dehydrogenase electron transfer subunit